MRDNNEWPESGEYVIITINAINPNSVFAKLDEYTNKSGMIHISEASNKWVQDLRQHFKIGQKNVAKVIGVDRDRGHISLSLKRVKPTAKRDKTAEWKNEKRALNLLSFVAKEFKLTPKELYDQAEQPLKENFDLIYTGFELAATDGAKALTDIGISKNIAEKIEEIAKKNIKPKEVEIKGILVFKSYASNGVEIIKDALKSDDENISITYLSAPKYKFAAKGKDYLSLEKTVSKITEEIIQKVKKSGGQAEFIRD
ncbi:MAG: translation initiation factor IF-2 subunit alpha, partial [Candidatus Aenigmarchaeota archaeon]|nr:translation initiation factor IF-2 subunit alpha [Candidatus Aenigmarchaeota archaeon]